MKSFKKITILFALIIVSAFSLSTAAYADVVPNSSDYIKTDIYINDSHIEQPATVIKGNIYIDIDTLQKYGSTNGWIFDTDNLKLMFNASDMNLSIGDAETSKFIKENVGKVEFVLKRFKTNYDKTYRYYVSLGSIAQFAKLKFEYKNSEKTSSVYITTYSNIENTHPTVKSNENICSGLLIKNSSDSLHKNELVTVLRETNSFYQVKDQDGNVFYINKEDINLEGNKLSDNFAIITNAENANAGVLSENNTIGLFENELVTIVRETTSFYQVKDLEGNSFYVNKEDLKFVDSESEIPDFSQVKRAKPQYPYPISAMWSNLTAAPEPNEGIDVFANLYINQNAKDDGSCNHNIDYGVIQSLHANGYKLWLCAQNGFSTDADVFINSNLADKKAANRTIAQYLFYACVFGADGISLDYESMSYGKSRDNFIDFVQTLCYYCDKLGLTSSVATYYGCSYNNTHLYPFDIFGECCDYILEMTYGEPYAKSLSNMSKNYWTTGTDYIATLAPKEKVILGVAYHMRYTIWNEEGEMVTQDMRNPNSPKSRKVKNSTIWADIRKYSIPYTWDEYTGQYYAEEPATYIDANGKTQNATAKYYMEDSRSAALKAQYIMDNELGGVIGWHYSYNSEMDIYDAYATIFKHGASYSDFVPEIEPTGGPAVPEHDENGNLIINKKIVIIEDDLADGEIE